MPEITHYEILGIPESATSDEIKNAIRAERRRWTQVQSHPNLERRQEAENRIRGIAQAEAELLNPDSRIHYDRTLQPSQPGPGPATLPEPAHSAAPDETPTPTTGRRPAAAIPTANPLLTWLGKNRGTAIAAGTVVVVALVIATSVSANGSRKTPSANNASISTVAPSTSSSPASKPTPTPSPTPTLRMSNLGESVNGAIYSGHEPFLVPGGSVDRTRLIAVSGVDAAVVRKSAIFIEGKVQRLASLIEYRTKAVDLEPAVVELRLNFYTAEMTRMTGSVTIATNSGTTYTGPNFDLIGSKTKNVIVTEGSGFSRSITEAKSMAYDGLTGQKLWSRAGTVQRTVEGIAVNYQTTERDDKQCYSFEGIEINSGTNVWTLDGSALAPGNPCAFATPSNQFWPERYVAIDGSGTNIVIDGASGAKMTWPDSRKVTVVVDPISGQAFAESYDSEPAYVFDPHTGRRGFSVPAAQAAALELKVVAFFDGKLYAKNTTGNLVLNATTGDTIFRDWKVRPVAASGDKILYSDGTFQQQGS